MSMRFLKHRTPVSRHHQRGVSVLSALLALVIGSIVSVGVIEGKAAEMQMRSGRFEGDVLNLKKDAANTYTMENYPALQNGLPVTKNGVTIPAAQILQPTVANLVAMGYLPANTSAQSTLNGNYQIRLRREPTGCVTSACNITGEVYIDAAVLKRGTTEMNGLIIGSLMDKVGGDVLVSLNTAPANLQSISGATVANPVAGTPAGVVGARIGFGASGFGRFLVLNDPRDPNFQGAVTIAGATTIGGAASIAGATNIAGATTINNTLAVGGTAALGGDVSVATCARILATTGRAGFGCANPNDLPAGYTGGVRTPDLVASGRVLASDNPAAFTGTNGNYAFVGVEAGVAEVRTSGRAAADRLTPLGQYAVGSACLAADEGSIARRSVGTGLVVCQGSMWTAFATRANAGDACSPDGSMATASTGGALLCLNGTYAAMDTVIRIGTPGQACTVPGATALDTSNNNETLICRANLAGGTLRYMRLRDMTNHLAFVGAVEVTDSSLGASGRVSKPTCSPAATQTATSIIQLIGKNLSSPDGGISLYAVDVGTRWDIYLRNGAGGVLTGSPNASAIAQVFCYFP